MMIFSISVHSMRGMVEISDPITETELADTSDPSGSLVNMVMVLLGAGLFFALLSTARATVTPLAQSAFSAVPGVQTDNDTGLIVEG